MGCSIRAMLYLYRKRRVRQPADERTDMKTPRYQIEWNDACLLGDKAAKNKVRDTLTGKVVWEGAGQGNTIMAEQDFSWGVRKA